MYAKIEDGAVSQYPYTVNQLKQDNPQTSFPSALTPETLAGFGMVPVISTGAQYDSATQVAELNGCVFNTERNRWETAWTVRSKTVEELAADQQTLQDTIVAATQARLDTFAATRNYDGILSACTYATSPTQIFAAEGQYCVTARDATWAKLYQILTEVQLNLRPMPAGYADIEAELPALEWPAAS